MRFLILGTLSVLATTSSPEASCVESPPAWSPDGRWLAYTVLDASPGAPTPTGWLLDASRLARLDTSGPPPAGTSEPDRLFRIWVSDRSGKESVLIEQSRSPLSAPRWGPDGRRLAYLRFVPRPGSSALPSIPGHCELVVQDGLENRRVALTLPEIELRPDQLGRFCALQPCWSPDGERLLFTRPGDFAAVLVVQAGTGRIRATLEGTEASWSPDGMRLAVVVRSPGDPSEQILRIVAADFSVFRRIGGFGPIYGRPRWSPDGQSILITASRLPRPTERGPELIRVQTDTGIASPILPVVPAASQRRMLGAALSLGRGEEPETPARVAADFERDQEQCVLAAQLPGYDPVIAHCGVRMPLTFKRFPPIDVSLGIGAIAMHPEGQLIAARVDGRERSGPAFLCQLGSEEVTPLAPDAGTRREWLSTIAAATLGLLDAALPERTAEGGSVPRLGPLPLTGEIPSQSSVLPRLRRLGKVGRGLVDPGSVEASVATQPDLAAPELDEYRLLFNYLAGQFAPAEADLAALERRADRPEDRLRLLVARAQIFRAQGRAEQALAIVNYLLESQLREARVVEETPAGLAFSTADDPTRRALVDLADRLGKATDVIPPAEAGKDDDEDEDDIDLRLPSRLRRMQRQDFGIRPLEPMLPRPMGPDQRPRFGGRPDGLPAEPLIPGGVRRPFPPLPPRPFQPVAPNFPRFPRPERPGLRR